MRIALLQLNYTVGDFAGNAAKILTAACKAYEQGADLCITSELSLWGYPPQDMLWYQAHLRNALQTLDKLSTEAAGICPILVGFVEPNEGAGKPFFNSVACVEAGLYSVVARKSLLPCYSVFNEMRYFEPNSAPPQTIEIGGKHLLITVCEDIWHDEGSLFTSYTFDPIAQAQAAHGVIDLVVNVSASPFALDMFEQRRQVVQRVSQQCAAPVVYCNQVGGNTSLIFDGGSFICTPEEGLHQQLAFFAEDWSIYDTSHSPAKAEADNRPHTQHHLCPEQLLHDALILGLHDFIHKSGLGRVVLGLSGGIDSALTAYLAVKALGADRVVGLIMPSPYSSQGSITDALALANTLGINTHRLEITPLMQAAENTIAAAMGSGEPGTTQENIQSRLRGMLLMAYANQHSAVVLNTGNKSELAVGYCTLYGDMAGAVAVIADLWKTQVQALCKYINAETEIIPENTITKPPSAELRPDQLDTDSLPDYDSLDTALKGLIEEHKTAAELAADGLDAAMCERAQQLLIGAEFKRYQASPLLCVSRNTLGVGRFAPLVCKHS